MVTLVEELLMHTVIRFKVIQDLETIQDTPATVCIVCMWLAEIIHTQLHRQEQVQRVQAEQAVRVQAEQAVRVKTEQVQRVQAEQPQRLIAEQVQRVLMVRQMQDHIIMVLYIVLNFKEKK